MTAYTASTPKMGFIAVVGSGLAAAGAWMRRRHNEAATTAALAQLDDHMLEDIGLNPADRFRPDPQRLKEALERRYPW